MFSLFCFVFVTSERFGEFAQISKTLRKIVSIISSFLEDQEARRVLQIICVDCEIDTEN